MGNISKKAGGPIRADEVGWEGLKKNPKADADAALLDLGLGGGVSKPIPVFTDETTSWTIYTVDKDEDDDKPGLYCLTIWDVPHDTMGLKLKYCYVRDDGTYGRVKWHPSYRLDDDERAAGRVEVPLGPLRARKKGASYKRIDIVRAVAVKRAAKDVGNPDLAEEDRRGKGTTPAYAPEALPPSGVLSGTNYWGPYAAPFANRIRFTSGPNTMATILTGDYITGGPRINSVGAPKKEQDGVYFPVNVGSTANDDLLVSVRFGVYRVGTKAGGATAYSKRIPIPRYEFTEEDLAQMESVGNVTVDVGPLKANKRYHIRWIRGRYSLDPDDTDAKVIRTRWPAAAISGGVDTTLNYISTATSPTYSVNDAGTNINIPGNTGVSPDPAIGFGPQLAVLAPTGDIVYAPSDPDASDIIINEPDLATEKDKDARIVLRVWAAGSDHTKSFADANVNRVAVVIRNITADGTTKQRRHAIDIEDPTALSVNIEFHRQIGRPLQWVKNVSLNEADRSPSATIALDFVAGDTGDITDISGLTLSITQDGDDNRQADAAVTFTNSATPAVPKRLVILRSKLVNDNTTNLPATLAEINNGNASWKPVFKKNLKADSGTLAVNATHTLTYTIPGVTMTAGIRYYRVYLFVVGDDTWKEASDNNTGGADSAGDMPIGDDTTYPTRLWMKRNGIVGDPAEGKAEAILRVYSESTGAGVATFDDQHIRRVGVVLYGISAWTGSSPPTGITLDTADIHRVWVDAVPTATFVDILVPLKAGKWYCWYETYASNNTETLTMTTGDITSTFQAGVGGNTSDLDNLTGAYEFDTVALSTDLAVSLTPVDARHTDAVVTYTQPASRAAAGGSYIPNVTAGDPDVKTCNIGDRTLPILMKRFFLEVKDSADFTTTTAGTGAAIAEEATSRREIADSLLDEASVYSALGAVTFTKRFKHKKNATIRARAVLVPFGANRASVRTRVSARASLAVTDDNITVDTTVPATVAAPTARYKDGSLRLKCVKPATSVNSLDYYEWQISNDPAFSTGASIYYIQDNDTTPVTASSSTIQSENRKLVIPITRTDLALLVPVSGSTARRPVLNFRVRGHNLSGVDAGNGAGNAAYSSAGTLTLGRADGDINRHGAVGRVNLVEGGGFMSARLQYAVGDPADQPGKWWKYRVITGMAGGAWRIENTRTGTASGTNSAGTADAGLSAVIWDAANHQLDFGYRGTGATLIYCAAATKLRRQLIAGEIYTLTFLLKSATAAFDPGTLVVGLTNDNSTTSASQSITFAGASDSTTPALGTSYRAYKATFTLASTPSGSAWLQFIFNNTAWTSGQHVYLDNICMVRGNQAMLFESAPADIVADESPLVTTFANGTESIGDVGGNGDDGIGTWGYMDV